MGSAFVDVRMGSNDSGDAVVRVTWSLPHDAEDSLSDPNTPFEPSNVPLEDRDVLPEVDAGFWPGHNPTMSVSTTEDADGLRRDINTV